MGTRALAACVAAAAAERSLTRSSSSRSSGARSAPRFFSGALSLFVSGVVYEVITVFIARRFINHHAPFFVFFPPPPAARTPLAGCRRRGCPADPHHPGEPETTRGFPLLRDPILCPLSVDLLITYYLRAKRAIFLGDFLLHYRTTITCGLAGGPGCGPAAGRPVLECPPPRGP